MNNLDTMSLTYKQKNKMKISFLGQGLSDTKITVGDILMESFLDSSFNNFFCLVAFASEAGVNGLSEFILKSKEHLNFKVFVGVDQKGTSKEALEALLKLDINSSVYYTNSHIIFHPKIYLFEGSDNCRIIIGSSNLTTTGLFQNIEASLMLEFSKPDKDGEDVLAQINEYFNSFFDNQDSNVNELNEELIHILVESKVVPDETERRMAQEKESITDEEVGDDQTINKIKELFPSVPIQRTPGQFRAKAKEGRTQAVNKKIANIDLNKSELLWEKLELPDSDVQYAAEGTNPTGRIKLTQSDFKDESGQAIDQTTYFRDHLFGQFEWVTTNTSPEREIAKILFHISILGVDKGLHYLTIRHTPSGHASQGNYTTAISWGDIGSDIADLKLAGRKFKLYGPPEGNKEPFFIEIV